MPRASRGWALSIWTSATRKPPARTGRSPSKSCWRRWGIGTRRRNALLPGSPRSRDSGCASPSAMLAAMGRSLSDAEFYRRLLGLGEHQSMRALLDDALPLLVERTEAGEALIEVVNEDGSPDGSHVVAHGCEGGRKHEILALVSRGIIGSAMATGKTIVTPNAALDPRFLSFDSVQRNALEAVLCTPIGRDVSLGVVYLSGRTEKLTPAEYGEDLRRDVETFARALSGPVESILARSRGSVPPPAANEGDPFSVVTGNSQAMRDVVDRLRLASPLDVDVLLTGPSGSGKTLLANAIHAASRRRAARFVEINCATLPES